MLVVLCFVIQRAENECCFEVFWCICIKEVWRNAVRKYIHVVNSHICWNFAFSSFYFTAGVYLLLALTNTFHIAGVECIKLLSFSTVKSHVQLLSDELCNLFNTVTACF